MSGQRGGQCKCLLESASASASTSAPLPPLSLSQGSPDRASCPNPLTFFFFFFLRIFPMASRRACALFTNMLLAGLGLKLKQAKREEVNRKPDQEEEKEVGRGGAGSPASHQRDENEDNEWRIFSVLFEKLLLRRNQWQSKEAQPRHSLTVEHVFGI